MEINPFEEPRIAEQWANSVESEHGFIRDKEIYPRIREFIEGLEATKGESYNNYGYRILDLGCGQGIASQFIPREKYIGMDSSKPLIQRASELYHDRMFVVGNAYDIPLPDESIDAVISINMFFHLQNPKRAWREIARVLRRGDAEFMVITANPTIESYKKWESMFRNPYVDDKKIIGPILLPESYVDLNVIYKHKIEKFPKDMLGLRDLRERETFGKKYFGTDIFIEYNGYG